MQQCRFKIVLLLIFSLIIIIFQYLYFNEKIKNFKKIGGIVNTYISINNIAYRENLINKYGIEEIKKSDAISLIIYLPSIEYFYKNETELNKKAFNETKELLCKNIDKINLYNFAKENLLKVKSFKENKIRYKRVLKNIKSGWDILKKLCNTNY